MSERLSGQGGRRNPEIGRGTNVPSLGSGRDADGGTPIAPLSIGVEKLLGRPIPEIPQAQLEWYNPGNLQLRAARHFSPQLASEALKQAEGKSVLSIDIGGDKIVAAGAVVRDGTLKTIGSIAPR